MGPCLLLLAACCLVWGGLYVPQVPDPTQLLNHPEHLEQVGTDEPNATPEPPDLSALKNRPLFTRGRRSPATDTVITADPVVETTHLPVAVGVALTGDKAVVVMKLDTQIQRVMAGDTIGEWTVTTIDRTSVALRRARQTLVVPVRTADASAPRGFSDTPLPPSPIANSKERSAPATLAKIARRDAGFRL